MPMISTKTFQERLTISSCERVLNRFCQAKTLFLVLKQTMPIWACHPISFCPGLVLVLVPLLVPLLLLLSPPLAEAWSSASYFVPRYSNLPVLRNRKHNLHKKDMSAPARPGCSTRCNAAVKLLGFGNYTTRIIINLHVLYTDVTEDHRQVLHVALRVLP